tara:strand:- start:791 stop:1150 length:360 start_codon:yes stop_codon:yes gene_type:complete
MLELSDTDSVSVGVSYVSAPTVFERVGLLQSHSGFSQHFRNLKLRVLLESNRVWIQYQTEFCWFHLKTSITALIVMHSKAIPTNAASETRTIINSLLANRQPHRLFVSDGVDGTRFGTI